LSFKWINHLHYERFKVVGLTHLVFELILLNFHPLDLVLVVKPHALSRLLNGLNDTDGFLISDLDFLFEFLILIYLEKLVEIFLQFLESFDDDL
jgi:hypothetical protein